MTPLFGIESYGLLQSHEEIRRIRIDFSPINPRYRSAALICNTLELPQKDRRADSGLPMNVENHERRVFRQKSVAKEALFSASADEPAALDSRQAIGDTSFLLKFRIRHRKSLHQIAQNGFSVAGRLHHIQRVQRTAENRVVLGSYHRPEGQHAPRASN
jgi:hypothetical protein